MRTNNFFKVDKTYFLTAGDRMKGTPIYKYLSKISTEKARRIFRRFWEEIPKIGEIELKPFDSYPSFYAGRRLVGVQPLKDQVKLHLTMEDAKYADSSKELRGAMRPHKGREEWAFIYIAKEKQVEPALTVIRKAYCKRNL